MPEKLLGLLGASAGFSPDLRRDANISVAGTAFFAGGFGGTLFAGGFGATFLAVLPVIVLAALAGAGLAFDPKNMSTADDARDTDMGAFSGATGEKAAADLNPAGDDGLAG
eukprot:scaffold8828_cov129-Isochrysis_galbana.AAC.6